MDFENLKEAAKDLGENMNEEEIEEMMTHLCLYVGFPKAVDGMRAVQEALDK